ncbi:hypothetical protein DFQ26_001247, partial [Actinomortierella ambigua]
MRLPLPSLMIIGSVAVSLYVNPVDGEPTLGLTEILKYLDMAGIRYPIGSKVCQVCK